MKDYSDFPPINYFLRVLKNCPESALLYIDIWKKKGRNMSLSSSRREIRKEFLISPTIFRNQLVALTYLNVIRFSEAEETFHITVSGAYKNDQ